MNVWFVRHAESVWNAEGRWQGQGDPPLSPRGRAQARALAETLAGAATAPVQLVASDLRRARETARILAARLAVPLELSAALRERDVGRWSGLAPDAIARRFGDELSRFRAGDPDVRPGGGESTRALRARAVPVLAGLVERAAGLPGPLAVVSHLGLLRSVAPGAELGNASWLPLADALGGRPLSLAEDAAPARDHDPGSDAPL